MKRIIDENTRCQFCNCRLKVMPKDIGQPAICVDCQKTKTKCTVLLVVLAIVIYFIIAFLALLATQTIPKATYTVFPALPTLVIIAFCLRNNVTKKIIERKKIKK